MPGCKLARGAVKLNEFDLQNLRLLEQRFLRSVSFRPPLRRPAQSNSFSFTAPRATCNQGITSCPPVLNRAPASRIAATGGASCE